MEQVYNIDVPDYIIGKFYSTFHFIGFWRIDSRIHFSQLIRALHFVLLTLSIFGEACTTGEQNDSIFLFNISLMCIVQIRRMYMLIWRKEEIFSLTQNVLRLRHAKDYEVSLSANWKLKIMTTLANSFVLVLIFVLLSGIIAPIFVKQLVFDIYFPLDYKTSRLAFWLAYVFIAIGTILSVVCSLVNVIAWYVMLNIVIRIEILGAEFQNLGMCKLRDENGSQIHLSMRKQQKLYEKQFAEAIETNLEIYTSIETK